jgi:uncharacterized membrane protein
MSYPGQTVHEGGDMFDWVMHWVGFGLCHQLPARSFIAGGHQVPVCARDTGVYVGFMISLALIAALDRGRRRTAAPPVWLIAVGLGLIAAMLWDGFTSYAGLRETTNLLRLATGTGVGFALALVIAPILNAQLWERRSPDRVLGSPLEGIVWCAAIPVAVAALWWGGPMLGIGYALLVAGSVIATFTSVNLVVVSLARRFERRSARLLDLWPGVLVAFALTVAEIAVADALRVWLLMLVSRG